MILPVCLVPGRVGVDYRQAEAPSGLYSENVITRPGTDPIGDIGVPRVSEAAPYQWQAWDWAQIQPP